MSSEAWRKWDRNVDREKQFFIIIAFDPDDIADQLLRIIHHQGTSVIEYITLQILQNSCRGFNNTSYFLFIFTILFD